MGWWNNKEDAYYAAGAWVNQGSTVSNYNWICYAAVGDKLADSYSLYKNGVLIAGPTTVGNNGPNGIRLGMSGTYTNEASRCKVSLVLAYNRVLTPDEIRQNYLATKGRYA